VEARPGPVNCRRPLPPPGRRRLAARYGGAVSVGSLVSSGPLIVAIPIAAAAGAVTFLSPCCLPLVPGYLSYVTGMSGAAAEPSAAQPQAAQPQAARFSAAQSPAAPSASAGPAGVRLASAGGPSGAAVAAPPPARSRVVLGTLLFVLGFSVLYTSYGLAFGELGTKLVAHQAGVDRVLGVVTIALGLLFAGLLDRFSFAGRIVRPSLRPRVGLAGAPLLGVMFGVGWSPCVGPTLSAVLTLAFNSGTAPRGAFLAFIYCLGLGVPFLIVALAFSRGLRAFGWARRHARLVTVIGGGMLVAVGLLEVTGAWTHMITWMQHHWIDGYNAPL
jgi:cytochrome c-type biogenesis protein